MNNGSYQILTLYPPRLALIFKIKLIFWYISILFPLLKRKLEFKVIYNSFTSTFLQ